eukprot:scaffold25556_cov70-Phaeocystis_antarctica.AAC.15
MDLHLLRHYCTNKRAPRVGLGASLVDLVRDYADRSLHGARREPREHAPRTQHVLPVLIGAHPRKVDLRGAARTADPADPRDVCVAVGAIHGAAAPPAARARHGGVIAHALEPIAVAPAQVAAAVPHDGLDPAHGQVDDRRDRVDEVPASGHERLVVQPPADAITVLADLVRRRDGQAGLAIL